MNGYGGKNILHIQGVLGHSLEGLAGPLMHTSDWSYSVIKNKSIIVVQFYAIAHYLREIRKFLCLENNSVGLALAAVKMHGWFF